MSFKLSSCPAYPERGMIVTHPFTKVADPVVIEAKTVDDVQKALRRYHDKIAEAHPGTQFQVSAYPNHGQRKPRGWDAAVAIGALRINRFIADAPAPVNNQSITYATQP